MQSEKLLDMLGNQNRRKILALLASRPCYMSEIAERLDVGAKAILGHLELLVQAGLIEANVDEQRRKYFHISDNLRLEVFVSPYSFEVETTVLDMRSAMAHQVRNNTALFDLKSLYVEMTGLIEQRHEIMQDYQRIQAQITEIMGKSMDAIEEVAQDNIEAEILYALLKSPLNQRSLSMQLGIPEYVLEEYLSNMVKKEMIKENTNKYSIN
jgi:ArsR family transcriptional regulator